MAFLELCAASRRLARGGRLTKRVTNVFLNYLLPRLKSPRRRKKETNSRTLADICTRKAGRLLARSLLTCGRSGRKWPRESDRSSRGRGCGRGSQFSARTRGINRSAEGTHASHPKIRKCSLYPPDERHLQRQRRFFTRSLLCLHKVLW